MGKNYRISIVGYTGENKAELVFYRVTGNRDLVYNIHQDYLQSMGIPEKLKTHFTIHPDEYHIAVENQKPIPIAQGFRLEDVKNFVCLPPFTLLSTRLNKNFFVKKNKDNEIFEINLDNYQNGNIIIFPCLCKKYSINDCISKKLANWDYREYFLSKFDNPHFVIRVYNIKLN